MRLQRALGALMAAGLLSTTVCCAASEPVCFRTAAEAASQTGVRGVAGYRLERASRDLYAGTVWALVRSCEHPERAAVLVYAGTDTRAAGLYSTPARLEEPRTLVLRAGARVQVVVDDGVARLEMAGIAQSGAAAGDHVRVRLLAVGDEPAGERFTEGIVSRGGTVQVVTR